MHRVTLFVNKSDFPAVCAACALHDATVVLSETRYVPGDKHSEPNLKLTIILSEFALKSFSETMHLLEDAEESDDGDNRHSA